jgi:hypothetical protein
MFLNTKNNQVPDIHIDRHYSKILDAIMNKNALFYFRRFFSPAKPTL